MKKSKKTLTVFIIIIVLLVAGGMYYFLSRKTSPNGYQATNLSKSWLIYTNNDFGFYIKYPEIDWVTGSTDVHSVYFATDNSATLSVSVIDDESVDSRIAAVINLIPNCSVEHTSVLVSGFTAKRMICEKGFFDNAGTEEITYLYIEKDGVVYEISFTLGRDENKNNSIIQSEFNEIVGTFGLNPIVKLGQLTFSNPKYSYSINYPDSWNVTDGDYLELDSSKGDRIDVYVTPNTTFEKYLQSQYRQSQASPISDCSGDGEYFTHKNVGQRCDWLGKEAYFFEKNGNLYSILLSNVVSPRSIIDGILNSFTI